MRDQIIDVMRSYGKPISPTQLARITGGSLGSVAYHVRTLDEAGIVEKDSEGQVRGAVEHFYALAPMDDEDDHAVHDRARALLSLCDAMTIPGKEGALPQAVLLDGQARSELQRELMKISPRVQAIASASTKRVEASQGT